MTKKISLLRVCLILIVIITGICVGFSYYTRLKEPVFLKYCVATSAVPSITTGYQQPALELQYLTNNTDQREVIGLSFAEAPDYSFIATENAQYYGGSFTFFSNNSTPQLGEAIGPYRLRKVFLYMNNYFLEDWKGEVELNNALVNFNDGSSCKVNLGRILIYSDGATDNALLMMNSTSSNQGIAETTFRAQQDLNNLKMESPLIEEASRKLELTLNTHFYNEIESLHLKRGDSLTVTSCDKSDPGMIDKNDVYDVIDVRPLLTYDKENGTRGSIRIYDMMRRKYFYGYMDVLKCLIRRGVF